MRTERWFERMPIPPVVIKPRGTYGRQWHRDARTVEARWRKRERADIAQLSDVALLSYLDRMRRYVSQGHSYTTLVNYRAALHEAVHVRMWSLSYCALSNAHEVTETTAPPERNNLLCTTCPGGSPPCCCNCCPRCGTSPRAACRASGNTSPIPGITTWSTSASCTCADDRMSFLREPDVTFESDWSDHDDNGRPLSVPPHGVFKSVTVVNAASAALGDMRSMPATVSIELESGLFLSVWPDGTLQVITNYAHHGPADAGYQVTLTDAGIWPASLPWERDDHGENHPA